MKLYVYCLVENLDTVDVPVPGINGAAVRLLKIDEFGVLVSDGEAFPLTKESAIAHHTVVRSILDQTTSLPFRFGSVVSEQQLRHYVATYKPALKKSFEHVRGCVEMDLKIIWQHSKPESDEPAETKKQGPGTAFLQQKRRELLGDERQSPQIAELSNLLRKDLGGVVRDEKIEIRPSQTAALAAVFHLVESANTHEYQEKVQEIRNNRPNLRIRMSGPWPPYSFANIELEFKTQFGVS
ncbi:MAG TPA: GvpL/GvpF family gas vesicle protein [Pyrinomonadaceae bacterium]|nr:GvpL/GvpF family gas vesicle protein [Pyrinomonadaceae bacterium]